MRECPSQLLLQDGATYDNGTFVTIERVRFHDNGATVGWAQQFCRKWNGSLPLCTGQSGGNDQTCTDTHDVDLQQRCAAVEAVGWPSSMDAQQICDLVAPQYWSCVRFLQWFYGGLDHDADARHPGQRELGNQ